MSKRSETIQKLKTSQNDIRSALEVKLRTGGGTDLPNPLRISQVAGYIEQIESGKAIRIIVTAPDYEGQELTATKGSQSFKGIVTEGQAIITIPEDGIWVVSAEEGTSTEIEIQVQFDWDCELNNKYKIYGIEINQNEADPDKRVVYTDDAVGMTPAKMNYSTGKFDYGDWENVWFMEENHVWALDSSGNRYKQCKDDDYSKYTDNTATDYSSTSSKYNFMASFPTCWIHRSMNDDKRVIKVANYKVDDTYHAYAWEDMTGQVQDYFYIGIYKGSIDGSKLRSLYNQQIRVSMADNQAYNNVVQYAQNNGKGYYVFDWHKYQAILDLLVLISKSTYTRKSFGNPWAYQSGSVFQDTTTGRNPQSGRFYGSNSDWIQSGASKKQDIPPKVFHIEDLWSEIKTGVSGCILYQNNWYVKEYPPYPQSTNGYTLVGSAVPANKTSYAEGFLKSGTETEFGFFPKTIGGSSTTYECDNYMAHTSSSSYITFYLGMNQVTRTYGGFSYYPYGGVNDANYITYLTYVPQSE